MSDLSLGKFSVILVSNISSFLFSLSSPPGSPITTYVIPFLVIPQSLDILFSFLSVFVLCFVVFKDSSDISSSSSEVPSSAMFSLLINP